MLPHLNQSRPGAHTRSSHHEHYTGSCPLSCPARRATHHHTSQHYPNASAGPAPFHPHHPNLDASKLHPAFSGLFFQQRRTYTTMQQQQPPPLPQNHIGLNSPGWPSIQPPPPGTAGLGDVRLQQEAPILDHYAGGGGGGGGGVGSAVGGGGGGPSPMMMMDPARTSPIFYGYASKPDKPKM
ncbi:hypothetical protein K457DRAFT_651352 [Linnemannia elongata AG-77]|uniref:Uncharacterized protein n=1 Tax=Linnemannia elongata AG-77 TaxID=1314771 RepID=A0A197KDD8_9FUNG|nr:hypothetical protein K457DRAFT_651352 [Linnemannia elongata AG-77]